MQALKIVGILLIVLGVFALGHRGLTYRGTEKVIDIGGLHVTTEKDKNLLPLSPLTGGAMLAGGIVLLLAGNRKF